MFDDVDAITSKKFSEQFWSSSIAGSLFQKLLAISAWSAGRLCPHSHRIFCWITLPVWSVESAILSTPIKNLIQGRCQVDWIRIQSTFHFLWDENSSFFIVSFNIVLNTIKITQPWNINWWPGVSWLWHWMEKGVSCSQHRVIYTHTHTYKNETICYSLGSN